MAEKNQQNSEWEASLRAIGRDLGNEFDCKEEEVPARIRQLLTELEAKRMRRNKD